MKIHRVLALLALLAVIVVPAPAPAQPGAPSVTQFSPQGVVKGVRQVVARFSAPMVPLGDPRPAIEVFDVDCPEAGTARWVDSREWAYDFARDLPAGVRCTFRLRAGVTTLDGTAVGGRREFTFSTGGPAVLPSSVPRAGTEWIDETQAFMLVLDAPADEASIVAHTHFVVEGVQSRVGARILTGKDRETILASRGKNLPEGPIVILQARQRFPNGARVTLVWGKGIVTTTGVPTTEEQKLEFRARPAFEVHFTCERERKDADCLPVGSLRVTFSAPVPWAQASKLALVGPGGRRWKAEARDTRDPLHWDVSFHAPFPEKATLRVEIPADFVDDANRRAVNAARFPLTVKTAAFPPLAKFAARFGILERADPVLPVTLRRLEPKVKLALLRADRQPKGGMADWMESVKATVFRVPPEASSEIQPWLRRVAEAKRTASVFGGGAAGVRTSELPKPGGADAFEVIGLPLGRPGLYIVELESARLGQSLLEKPGSMYVPTAALVTNLSVHLKWGAENALVWVTALDSGRPVSGAKVTIQDCSGAVRWRGATDGQGLARVTGLPARAALPRCDDVKGGDDWEQSRALRDTNDGLLVIAQTPDDLGLVHTSWDEGIQPWRFNLPTAEERGPLRAHSILDRPLFRAGETVHMKHVIRRPSLQGFEAVPEAGRPRQVVLKHLGSDEKYEFPLTWNPAGTAETTWKIPTGAKLGSYSITLVGRPLQRARWMKEDTDVSYASGMFRVEEFRLPTLRAVLRPPTEPLVDATDVALDIAVTYLAGGGARRLPVTVRTQVQPHPFPTFEGFENFTFANGAVTEGVTRRARGDDDEEDDESSESAPPTRGKPAVHQRDSLTLDDQGTGKATVRKLPRAAVPRDLLVELEYRDPSGETQTAARRLTLWPSTRLVGLVPEGGEVFGETLKAHAAVIDLAGKPVAGVPVTVEAFERKLYSHRKRLVGGFYAYEHVQEVRRLGELCRGTTSPGGMLICEGKAPATGSLILQATARDEQGRATVANADVWVVDPELAWWFEVREHDRMDVLPERRRWEPGETARLQVRMPFREATALVTVEREGVLDARIVKLSGSQPVIELPVLGTYAPNVFVSVLAVRGRVAGVQPTALVDLGRPAFKLGLAEIRVGWRAHELKVTVTPERDTYKVRERARVRVKVVTADGKPPAPGSEVALAAVDEALLELAPNPSWDLLPAMLTRRALSLTTSTAQLHVVGKRHFGLKALPAGGGGGRQTTRELFDTLLYWNARVALDERGEATVEIPLNDSLTSFRVVAVATSGTGLFGTGAGTFKATQDLMLLAGLPPLVRNGDRFAAEVTLRNATARPMEVVARARVEGLGTALEPRAATLAAGESRAVTWDVTVPAGASALAWEIEAGERGGAMDRLRLSQKVVSPVPVRTYQATLFQAEAAGGVSRQAVERPSDSIAGQGGVRVTLAPTLVTGIEPVRDWMTRYPYTCLEQEVSRAVALKDAARWKALVERMPSYVDGDGLLKYFPGSLEGSDVLTAYVSAVAHEAGFKIPPEIEKRLDEALAKFVEGKLRRGSDIARPDLTLRKLAALEALARRGHADPKLVSTIAVEPNLWPTSGVLDWWSVLRRVYNVPQRAPRLAEAEQIVRARLNVQGTTMGFSTEASDRLWWLMVSTDVNAVRLILTLIEAGAWRDEVPRLMRAALARQQRGVWDLTVANAWGTLAVERFAREFEKTPVAGVTTTRLGGERRSVEWVSAPRGRVLAFPWPAAADEVTVAHEGAGRPWVTIETQAAIPLRTALSSGYRVVRTLVPVERRDPRHWSRGDVVRVRLQVDAQSDMTWVVINDPIPAGASHLGRGLGGESAIAAGGERQDGWAWPAFQERAFEGFRAYYRYVPKGPLTAEYTIRLNQAGRFVLPPTRVEALYAPEMFGELPNAVLEVAP